MPDAISRQLHGQDRARQKCIIKQSKLRVVDRHDRAKPGHELLGYTQGVMRVAGEARQRRSEVGDDGPEREVAEIDYAGY